MDNSERIRKWREGRLRVAEAERAARDKDALARAEEARRIRQDELAEKREVEYAQVAASLPDAESIKRAKMLLQDRRREHGRRLLRSLAFFVALPALVAGVYLYFIAVPFYEANASFAVLSGKDEGVQSSAVVGLFAPGSSMADGFKVHEYILSRQMMMQMEQKYGLMTHFSSDEVDFVSRFDGPMGINSNALDYFRSRVAVSVDIQQGLLRLTVQARSPEMAVTFVQGLLKFAEEHVNTLSERMRTDQLSALVADAKDAEWAVLRARQELATVQLRNGDIAPKETTAAIYQLISGLETQVAEAQSERDGLLKNGLDRSPAIPRLDARIQALNKQIAEQRGRLLNAHSSRSIQKSLSAYDDAMLRKEFAQTRWDSTLHTLEQAKLLALRERRYLEVVTEPSLYAAATKLNPATKWSIFLLSVVLLYVLFAILVVARELRE